MKNKSENVTEYCFMEGFQKIDQNCNETTDSCLFKSHFEGEEKINTVI